MVSSLHYADGAVLVTEPSAFGLHDLKMAVKLVRNFNLPFGVIVNKYNGDDRIQKFCQEENIPVLGTITYQRKAAEVYSAGKVLVELSVYKKEFCKIAEGMRGVFPWNWQ